MASRTISWAELNKFEKFDVTTLIEEQRQALIPLLNDATRKLISSEAIISLADLSKFVPYSNSDVNATLKMIMPEVIISSYTKLSAVMPTDILKLCCEKEFILDEPSLKQLIGMMETENVFPKIPFIVACLKKVGNTELLVKRLLALLPIDSFVEALQKEQIPLATPLFAHLLEASEIENVLSFANYLPETQLNFLILLNYH